MEFLLETDREWMLYLNHHHTPWLDPIAYWITKTWVWFPLFILLALLSIKTFKKETWMVFVAIVFVIVFADQVTTSLMKPFFARLRPSNDPTLADLVHIVNEYRGGRFGFASGHAANTFGTSFFFFFIFRDRYKWISLLFVWAALMSYTRIYLGVHYPGDIIVGMLVGLLGALFGLSIFKILKRKYSKDPSASTASTE